MKLGIFDSGLGGLTVLRSINELLPEVSTIYFGDNANAPYGVKSFEEIFEHTLAGVRFLFSQGCPLVILACNTASAQALRKIQQEILPVEFPDRRVLGVIRPTVEYLVGLENVKKIGVFGTVATVRSEAYVKEFEKITKGLDHQVFLCQKACPGLADAVEAGLVEAPETVELVQKYCQDFDGDLALLGCTHYPFLQHLFEKYLPIGTKVFTSGPIVARKLHEYLYRHPEIDECLDKTGERFFYTTGDLVEVGESTSKFCSEKIDWLKAEVE
jgi:glutamate racemase